MKEVWKDIKGYENLYQISNCGNVRCIKNGKNLILKQTVLNVGYKSITLYKNKKQKKKLVHRLICDAFIPNFENKPQVNHKDGNKLNNSINNLEWCTCQENRKHAYDIGIKKSIKSEKCYTTKLNEAQVKKIRKSNISTNKLANKYNVGIRTIQYILAYKTWKHI